MGRSILTEDASTLHERAIIKLYTGEKKAYYARGYAWRKGRKRYTNANSMTAEEVAELFGITAKEVKKIKQKYSKTWNRNNVTEYVMDFIKREGRWPTYKDFNNAVANKIPGHATINRVFWRGNWEERSGYSALQEAISTRKDITPEIILTIPNITVRREAINNYGFNKMVKKKVAQKISEDSFGILWHIPQSRDEDMYFVEVENKTPEADGTFAHYFLRVPEGMESAQQAVAWTFGVPTDQEWENFSIEVET